MKLSCEDSVSGGEKLNRVAHDLLYNKVNTPTQVTRGHPLEMGENYFIWIFSVEIFISFLCSPQQNVYKA